jgi:hypothetical protein
VAVWQRQVRPATSPVVVVVVVVLMMITTTHLRGWLCQIRAG